MRPLRVVPGLMILLTSVVEGGCGDGARASSVAVRDSSGVRIVETASSALEYEMGWVVGSEPVLSLGVMESPPAQAFSSIRSAFRIPDGRIVVQGGGDPAIGVFSPGGEFLNGIGQLGEGPGEWKRLGAVGSLGGDTLLVYDGGAPALIHFDAEGVFLREVPLDPPQGDVITSPVGNPVYLGREGAVAHLLRVDVLDGERQSVPYVLFEAMTGAVLELAEIQGPVWGVRRVAGPSGRTLTQVGVMDPRWAAFPEAVGLGGRFVTADGVGFRLREWSLDGEGLVAEYRLSDMAVPPDALPSLGPILMDEAGHVWVREYEPPSEPTADEPPTEDVLYFVVSPDGVVSGHVRLPRAFGLVHVSEDEVFVEVRDALDVPRLLILPLTRG